MKKLNFTILFLIIFVSQSFAAVDSLRIMNWNLLNFSGSDTTRVKYYRDVISYANPDIFVCQEISGIAANKVLYTQVFQVFAPGQYDTCTFDMGPDTGNLLFFKKSKARFIANTPVRTELRYINEFKMYLPFIADTVRLYSCHLKASQGTDEEAQRGREVDTLRYVTNRLPLGKYFMVMGDFNIYRSGEAAYQKLLAVTIGEGQFYDPIPNMTGTWNNASYAPYHTQSPRVRSFGGGATGGMDDRFDMILHSKAITINSNKLYFVNSPGRYFALGNDGNHFNDSLNQLPNNSAPLAVINGIHYASDHIPVIGTYMMTGTSGVVTQTSQVASNFNLSQNYPNPFNPTTTINFDLPVSAFVSLIVYDMNGKQIMNLVNANKTSGKFSVNVDASALPSGTYFYRLQAGNFVSMKKMVLLK
jgi:endonuclease/exonuclease/phosphatase family metal-dependent hydrolase